MASEIKMEREGRDKTRPQGCKTARPARSARHWHSFSPSIGAEDVGVGNVHGCGCGDIVVHNRNVGIGKEGRPHILKIDERWSGSGGGGENCIGIRIALWMVGLTRLGGDGDILGEYL